MIFVTQWANEWRHVYMKLKYAPLLAVFMPFKVDRQSIYWSFELPLQEATKQVQVDENIVVSWYSFIVQLTSSPVPSSLVDQATLFSWLHRQSHPSQWTRPHHHYPTHGRVSETRKCARSSRPMPTVDFGWQHMNALLIAGDAVT